MKPYLKCNVLFYCLAWSIMLCLFFGCAKDYSYEGGPQSTTILDTIPVTTVAKSFPECALCNPDAPLALGTWNFKTGNAFVCGKVDNSGFIGTNRTFTFFGPSACSIDTGLVMTVYLPISFDQDRFDITTAQTAFYYYDHFGTKDIFISLAPAIFTVTVNSYMASTRIATGTFGGTVYKASGDTAVVSEGHFKVHLK